MAHYLHKRVMNKICYVNNLTGKNFTAEYNKELGGWCMYEPTTEGGCSRSYFGFDARKTTREFLDYLEGIITALCWVKNHPRFK